MDIVQEFSNEALGMLLQKMNERNEQVLDIVQLLMMSADAGENNQKKILKGIEEIRKTTEKIDSSTEEINSKMDVVLEKLTRLELDFDDLKHENREIEQKLILMTSKLSKLDSSVEKDDLEEYYALAQSLYSNWGDLDTLTRKFIPLAEYLYSKLQKYDKLDYSPVILELCRAIENELLLKIFRKYTLDVVDRKGRNLDIFLAIDRATYQLKNKTNQFVKAVSKAAKTRKPEYTLGQMNTILSIMKEEQTVRISPLLQDFKAYLEQNTEVQNLLDAEYIDNVNDIVKKYRNPSAHPEFMPIEKANKCREIMPDRLDYLLDCINA